MVQLDSVLKELWHRRERNKEEGGPTAVARGSLVSQPSLKAKLQPTILSYSCSCNPTCHPANSYKVKLLLFMRKKDMPSMKIPA